MRPALLAALLSLPAACFAQTQGQPRLSLAEPDFDFGRIGPVQIVTHRFKASNTGSAPLTIANLAASCGCTSTVLGRKTLAPGESTELEVTFNPAGQHGVTRKAVQVFSDDPVAPAQTLTFQADVLAVILVSPEEVRFTDLTPRDRRKASVKVESLSGQPILLSNAELSEAPWLGVATREEDNNLWVDLDLLARRLPPARLSGIDTINLHVNNPGPSIVTVNVRWERRPPVSATPAQVAWAEPAGRDLRASVQLKTPDGKPFRILSARTSTPLLQVTGISRKASASQTFQVRLAPTAPAGQHEEEAILTLDTPGRPEFELRVSAALD